MESNNSPFLSSNMYMIHHGDCRELPLLPVINSIITDPPYEVGIYGHEWDKQQVAHDVSLWKSLLSVVVPGGYMAAFGARKTIHRMVCAMEDAGWIIEDQLMWIYSQGMAHKGRLKAAHEPIILARKPGRTSGLHIDNCRIPWEDGVPKIGTPAWGGPKKKMSFSTDAKGATVERRGPHESGRWPGTILHDGSKDVLDCLGEQARFFYATKANKKEKVGGHPTQKPLELMKWLVGLLAQPGDIVLDPFCGSGTTLEACYLMGVQSIGIEKEAQYVKDAQQRMMRVKIRGGC